jgi:DNA segregation ATPase FtsK/SpoIIIE and related proteins
MVFSWFYKGLRIRRWHRYVFNYIILIGYLLSICVPFFHRLYHSSFLGLEVKPVLKIILLDTLIATFIYLILLFLVQWILWHIYNMQKICQMIFNSMYYNLEGETVGGKIVSREKTITYFPKMYYRYRKKKIEVTVKLDGSKFHLNLTELNDMLGDIFAGEIIEDKIKSWYKIYVIEDVRKSRMKMSTIVNEVCPDDYIRIMDNIEWNYIKAPHALITGGTGGGKSLFMLYLFRMCIAMRAIVKVIDPKRSELYQLYKIIGVENVGYATGRILKILREAVEEMEVRYIAMDKNEKFNIGEDYRNYSYKPMFILFDEFIAGIIKMGKEDHKRALEYMYMLVLQGRQAGIYLILGTQRADAEFLKGAIRDNLGLRVSLGALEKEGYRITFGNVDKDLKKFEAGHGYLYINGQTSTVREFYSAYFDEKYDFAEDIEELFQECAREIEKIKIEEREDIRDSEHIKKNEIEKGGSK